MISEWMDNGNIREFEKAREGVNRIQLVSGEVTSREVRLSRPVRLADAADGLEYVRSFQVVYGDLKGDGPINVYHTTAHNDDQANILINGTFHAGLERRTGANPSLASVDSEVSPVSCALGGTTR